MTPDILDLRFAFLVDTVMAAGEEDDEEDEEEDEEDEESEEEEEPKGGTRRRPKPEGDPRVKAANDEAKKFRLQLKAANRTIRELKEKEEEKAEKEKPEIERLRGEVSKLKKAVDERDELRLRVAVLEKAIHYKVSGDVDFLEYKLRKKGLLTLDEEGDLPEEFDEAVKALAKEMTASEKDGDESGDRSDEGEKPTPPRSPQMSGGRKKGNKQESDLEAMRKRFPALTQRS